MPAIRGLHGLIRGVTADLAQDRKVQVAGVSETLAQLLVLGLMAGVEPALTRFTKLVIVLPGAKDLPAWSHFASSSLTNLGDVKPVCGAVLPFYAAYGNDRFINPSVARRQRLYALAQLAFPATSRAVIVTTVQALAQTTLPPAVLRAASLSLAVGEERDQDELIQALDDLGYTSAPSVSEEGTYAVRGGIIDVFPLNVDEPLRLEFLGDQLASLRHFTVADQKSKLTVERALIVPAYEALTPEAERREQAQTLFNTLLEQGLDRADRDGMVAQFQQGAKFAGFDMLTPLFRPAQAVGFDYLDDETLLVFPAAVAACTQQHAEYIEALTGAWQRDQSRGRAALPVPAHFASADAVQLRLEAMTRLIEFGNPYATQSASLYRVEGRLSVEGAPVNASVGAELFDKWVEVIEAVLKREDGAVAVFAHGDEQLERIVNLLGHRGLKPQVEAALLAKVANGTVPPGAVLVGRGDFATHSWLEEQSLLVLPEQALFGIRSKKPKTGSQKLQNYLSSFADLKTGDLVVHVQHGIGRYKGLTSLTVGGLVSDFLVLEYAGGDKIYLPVDRLSLLQRYSGGEGSAQHPLDKLGGQGWEKRKARVKGVVRDMADELLKLQARRAVAQAAGFGPPDETYLKFEAEFPFEETEDQIRAIHDVEADLRSGKPTDRLICGDVGFGKTEVALRAAMRTVLEGMQVLVLVPTTVLCYQHYRTFQERLEAHGVRVAQVNRFVKGADMKVAIDGLTNGTVDVLVGTHRLLSKDVKPKRLGLLVVDEEQRFGVVHKEKLKNLRAGAHVMTLTATPIPRTLHMAMVGLRDISVIATPPEDRLPVKTYIARFDETLIKDAIEHEVKRGGQVFFVHNRVEDIEEVRLFLKSLAPTVDIRIAHGQMKEHQLEAVIVDFLEQKFQVLLCTTIIESGIDMPSVNTLIVDRADRYGLAQLYQLRGRVGRANRQAYAYFLTPAQDYLSEDAQKRLDVLAAHQELGAGFQIASHDLELRGAGNLLGGEQSGHAAAIGFELYTEMLEEAIHELRGERVEERIDTEIKLPISALIPPAFVPAETERLHLYKRLFAADAAKDLASLRQEAQDRYGALPPEFALLFKVARLKQQLRRLGALRLTTGPGVFELRCAPLAAERVDRIMKAAQRQPGVYKLAPEGRLLLFLKHPQQPTLSEQDALLGSLIALVEPLVEGLSEAD